jgi:predicted ATPase
MRLALERHDVLLREAIESRHGRVFKTVGDAFCAAFATATDAVAAALTAQRRFLQTALPTSQSHLTLRVRVALHTGNVEQRAGDYFGPALNRVARLLAVAHGGQVLLSGATAELVQEDLPPEATLRSLGEHRLRDLQRPESIFQLLHPDLPADFPPLASLSTLPHNLPQPATSFIGREREIAEVKALLVSTEGVQVSGEEGEKGRVPAERVAGEGESRLQRDGRLPGSPSPLLPFSPSPPERPNARLVTITGSGGTGKTRLALQVAAALLEDGGDGVWLAELASLADAALVPQAVATVLAVREEPGKALTATLVERLRQKRLLLVLDNCEHLLGACAALAEALLRGCPRLRILATSREGLSIPGETTYRLPSLFQNDAVRLFVQRAQAATPSFTLTERNAPVVAQICHRLDGVPLAIELAAARVRVLPVEQIAARLDDRFRLLTGGSRTALPRQQTLRALIDWSYDLLTEPEQALLRQLSVFSDGWTLEAAEAVCAGPEGRRQKAEGSQERATTVVSAAQPARLPSAFCLLPSDVLDLLTALVEKSLVLYEAEDARYRLLETVRQYARDRLLESGEGSALRDRHAQFFMDMTERLHGEAEASGTAVWLAWFDRTESEHDNCRAALEWLLGRAPEAALRLSALLFHFWIARSRLTEGREWLERALEAGRAAPPALRAKPLVELGFLAFQQGDYPRARVVLEESLALARQSDERWTLSVALGWLSRIAQIEGDDARAQALMEESWAVATETRDPVVIGMALGAVLWLVVTQGDHEQMPALIEEFDAAFQETGEPFLMSVAVRVRGEVALRRGEYDTALPLLRESLRLDRTMQNTMGMSNGLFAIARIWAVQQRFVPAARLLGAAEALLEAIQAPLPPIFRAPYEAFTVTLQSALGAGAFAAARAEGAALPLDTAIDEALESLSGA